MDINGAVALITGGADGIGLATATGLLRNGAKHVTLVDVNAKSGEEVTEKLRKEFGSEKVTFIKVDVRNLTELEDAFKKTVERFNTIDIVFNCAGIIDEINWERTIDVNFRAVVAGTHFSYKYLAKHKGGKGGTVLNASSLAALAPFKGGPVYTATKFGVLGLDRAFGASFHYHRSGIRILTIYPSLTQTNILNNAIWSDEETVQAQKEDVQILTPQTAEEIAEHIINVLKNGENETHWFIEGNRNYGIKFPTLEELDKTELPLP